MPIPQIDPVELSGRLRAGSCSASAMELISAVPGRVMCRLAFDERQLRLGRVISGPTQMMAADAAAYALALTLEPEATMAVTASLSMHFLAPLPANDLLAEATLLGRTGRKVFCDVKISTAGDAEPASHATVTYMLPRPAAH